MSLGQKADQSVIDTIAQDIEVMTKDVEAISKDAETVTQDRDNISSTNNRKGVPLYGRYFIVQTADGLYMDRQNGTWTPHIDFATRFSSLELAQSELRMSNNRYQALTNAPLNGWIVEYKYRLVGTYPF